MRIAFYHSKEERKNLLKEAHQNNERNIHNDFVDEDGNATDGKVGRITFIKENEPIPVSEGALFTSLSLDFSIKCDAVRTLNLLFPEMYESYDKQNLVELKKKLNIPISRKVSWEETLAEYGKTMSEKNLKLAKESGKNTFSTKPDELTEFVFSLGMMKMVLPRDPQFLCEMGLIYLVTTFEEFLKDILRAVSKVQIMHDEISVDFEAEKTINRLLKKDITKLRKKLNEKYQMDIGESQWKDIQIDEKDWKRFCEYFYRRNILIHTNGFPDEQYRDLSDYDGNASRLGVDKEYLLTAIKDFKKYSHNLQIGFRDKYASD